MSMIHIENLTFAYDNSYENVFENVCLHLEAGFHRAERAQQNPPSQSAAYVKQDSSGMSGSLEDYAAGLGIDESLFKAILRKLDFTREQFEHDISEFSAGQKKKVLLAGSLSEQAHIYIWDEPLNYIDVISRVQIEELLAEYRPTLLFVEHDDTFCENIASKTIFM